MLEPTFQQSYPIALRAAQAQSAEAARVGFPPCDLQDLEQEAVTRVWQALSKYDPARSGLRTFIEMVVSTRVASILRSYRHRPGFECLDGQYVSRENEFREMELRTDVRRVLARVSLFDRVVALSLVAYTVTDTSRSMGVSRRLIYQAIGRLRLAFAAAGFGGHRTRSCTTRDPHRDAGIEHIQREFRA
jgi:RNA polymerase sigma factor (sigma-70 family)